MKSNNLLQIDLPLRGDPQAVDIGLIKRQGSMSGSLKLCVSLSGFDSAKQVYMALGIDAGHWSRISKGDAHFPQDKLGTLMDVCGNEAPLLWLAHSRGYELRPLESELEKTIREQADEIEQLKHERDIEHEVTARILKQAKG